MGVLIHLKYNNPIAVAPEKVETRVSSRRRVFREGDPYLSLEWHAHFRKYESALLLGAFPKRTTGMHRDHMFSQIHEAFATVAAVGTVVTAFFLVDDPVPVQDSRMTGGKVTHIATKDFADVQLTMQT